MIELQQVSIFQNNRAVIEDINMSFNTGEFWGIIGRNGVGKSTLLEAIAGINNQHHGDIEVDQVNLRDMTPLMRAQKMSYLLQEQEPSLAFLVKDAIGMGRFPWLSSLDQDQQITEEVMRLCQLNDLQDRSILRLSGGERRKVEIATCLVQQAKYLLLDEPLNHLDVVYQHHIMQVFKDYSKQQGVLMVCHDIETVKNHCTHVLMLLGKDCYLSGTSATILSKTNLDQLFNDHR